jgi:DnaJ-class molecular chaperone
MIKTLKNYYEILDINNKVTEDEIYKAYNQKISQFNHLPFHTSKMIYEIKLLKEALYVLGDDNKRKKYDYKYQKNKQYEVIDSSIDNTKVCERLFSIIL